MLAKESKGKNLPDIAEAQGVCLDSLRRKHKEDEVEGKKVYYCYYYHLCLLLCANYYNI